MENSNKYAIVISRFNESITNSLLSACQTTLQQNGVREEDIVVTWVPGAFEIPLIAQKMATTNDYAAVICLGAVIQGETPHFDYICQAVAHGITDVGLRSGVPVIFGVLTTDTLEQAQARSGDLVGNKGTDAALAAIEMAKL